MSYDLGDVATLTYAPDGYVAATCSAVLSVVSPLGVTTTPTVTEGADSVTAVVPLTAVGAWYYTWTASGAVVDVTRGQLDVSDPAPPLYASLTELRDRCGIEDEAQDAQLLSALKAACRQVEKDTRGIGQRFTLDAAVSTRTFETRGRVYQSGTRWYLLTDDIGSTSGLLVAGTAPASTEPANALVKGRAIEAVEIGSSWSAEPIAVTARWGWPAIPDDIVEASLLRAHRLFRRRGSPEGVAGFADMGAISVRKTDPDYEDLTSDYVRPGLA